MSNEDQTTLFVRLLNEALEDDRLIRSANLAVWQKANAAKTRRRYKLDLGYAMESIEPLDCIQMMRSRTKDLGIA